MATPDAATLAGLEAKLEAAKRRRSDLTNRAEELLLEQRASGVEELTGPSVVRFRAMRRDIADAREDEDALDERVREYRSELARVGDHPLMHKSAAAADNGRHWAHQVTERALRVMGHDGERRAVVSGELAIPALVVPEVIAIARPARLVDLLINRAPCEGNSFEYYVQSVRTNKADAVADGQLKPTSTLTVKPVSDRVRVLAHLSEPCPLRIWDDFDSVQSWLQSEMREGVLDCLEQQVISGDPTAGNAESMVGLLNTTGTTPVPFTVDAVTTLRNALTRLQIIGEQPNAWILNPQDAENVDLTKWGTSGGFLTEGFVTGVPPGEDPSSANIFGDSSIRRVISNSVPAGTAVLGDWSKLKVFIRQDATLALDASGDLFTKNLFVARCEMRAGIGVLRPSAFAVIDLSATTTTAAKK